MRLKVKIITHFLKTNPREIHSAQLNSSINKYPKDKNDEEYLVHCFIS